MQPSAELVEITPNAEMHLEKSIRVCYNSFDKCDGTIECARDLIRKIIGRWHTDTLEHASASFHVKCSRSCMAQFTRHRHASFGVQSQRYVKYEQPVYITPPGGNPELFAEMMESAFNNYKNLLTLGMKKEDARFVLPEAWATEFYVTMNLRSWRDFIMLRSDKAAQWEIRSLSNDICDALYKEVPSVFEDLMP